MAAGGALGTLSRYGVGHLLPEPGGLPLATFLVNLSGAFLLGWLLEHLASAGPDAGALRLARLGAGTGFLGGFTTYSALSVEAVLLLEAGRTTAAALYLAGTLVLGFTTAFVGMAAAGWVRRRQAAASVQTAPAPRPGAAARPGAEP